MWLILGAPPQKQSCVLLSNISDQSARCLYWFTICVCGGSAHVGMGVYVGVAMYVCIAYMGVAVCVCVYGYMCISMCMYVWTDGCVWVAACV